MFHGPSKLGVGRGSSFHITFSFSVSVIIGGSVGGLGKVGRVYDDDREESCSSSSSKPGTRGEAERRLPSAESRRSRKVNPRSFDAELAGGSTCGLGSSIGECCCEVAMSMGECCCEVAKDDPEKSVCRVALNKNKKRCCALTTHLMKTLRLPPNPAGHVEGRWLHSQH